MQGTRDDAVRLLRWISGPDKWVKLSITSIAAQHSSGTKYEVAAVCHYHGEHDIQDLAKLTFRRDSEIHCAVATDDAVACAAAPPAVQHSNAPTLHPFFAAQNQYKASDAAAAHNATVAAAAPGAQATEHLAHESDAGDDSEAEHHSAADMPAQEPQHGASAGAPHSAVPAATVCTICQIQPSAPGAGKNPQYCRDCRSRFRCVYELCRQKGLVFRRDQVNAEIAAKGLNHPFWSSADWQAQKREARVLALLGDNCMEPGGVLGPRTAEEVATGRYQPGRGGKRARTMAERSGNVEHALEEAAAAAPAAHADAQGTCKWCGEQSMRKRKCDNCESLHHKMYVCVHQRAGAQWDLAKVEAAIMEKDAADTKELWQKTGPDAVALCFGGNWDQPGGALAAAP
jgi:hypothetical protein